MWSFAVISGLSGAAESALWWYFNAFCRSNQLTVSTSPAAPDRIRVDPRRSKHTKLLIRVPERAAQPLGPGPTVAPQPLLAATRSSTRRGPPIAAPCRHPGRSASFKAQKAARPRAKASRAAYSSAQGPPARYRADGGTPATTSRLTHEHWTWAPIAAPWHHPGRSASFKTQRASPAANFCLQAPHRNPTALKTPSSLHFFLLLLLLPLLLHQVGCWSRLAHHGSTPVLISG